MAQTLTRELSNVLEDVQKRALHIILSELNYNKALVSLRLKPLKDRKVYLYKRYFEKMQNPDHKLDSFLREPRNVDYNLRLVVKSEPLKVRTLQARGSLVNWAAVIMEF